MRFQYFEIRPCVTTNGETHSFHGAPQWNASIGDHVFTAESAAEEAEEFRAAYGEGASAVFWTLYGLDEEGLAVAVGDFSTKGAAFEIMDAIITPMAAARDKIRDAAEGYSADVYRVADDLDDFINQCSNGERI